jgi:hypothetical protein
VIISHPDIYGLKPASDLQQDELQSQAIACVSDASIPGTSFTATYRAAALISHLRMSFTS